MRIIQKQCLFCLFCFGAWFACPAQHADTDSMTYHAAIDHVIGLYTDSLQDHLRIYNGTEFTGGYRSSAGHPFFGTPEPVKGAVIYEGTLYPDLKLFYDLNRDELIFVHPGNNLNIKLVSQKVDGFTLPGHNFVRIREDEALENFPGEGFYEVLYDEGIAVLAKRTKRLRESARAEERSRFVQADEYYARKNNRFYAIDGKRSLLAFCGDRKSEVARFIQQENLVFKKNPEDMIVRVIQYYTQLTN